MLRSIVSSLETSSNSQYSLENPAAFNLPCDDQLKIPSYHHSKSCAKDVPLNQTKTQLGMFSKTPPFFGDGNPQLPLRQFNSSLKGKQVINGPCSIGSLVTVIEINLCPKTNHPNQAWWAVLDMFMNEGSRMCKYRE